MNGKTGSPNHSEYETQGSESENDEVAVEWREWLYFDGGEVRDLEFIFEVVNLLHDNLSKIYIINTYKKWRTQ